jgi:hypothetical protein
METTRTTPNPDRHPPGGRKASDATGINVDQRRLIDPRMPDAPPA